MIFCGIKLTHDGAVALIDRGKLIFSVEMEKLPGGKRHDKLRDLGLVFDLLAEHGYSPQDVDTFAIDGWRRTEKDRLLFGQEVRIRLAPYRRGLLSRDPLTAYPGTIHDFRYSSYYHYSTHALGAYCASPFAAAGEASWVLVWDGAMFPNLYFIDLKKGTFESCGNLSYLLGNAYHEMALLVPPFNTGIIFPQTLSIPGKMMALIARGSIQPELMDAYAQAYEVTASRVIAVARRDDDLYYQEPLGQRFLAAMLADLPIVHQFRHEDVLASWHQYLFEGLSAALGSAIQAQANRSSSNLVFCGGCGLNIKWNSGLRALGSFSHVWIPPFPNDSGSALGAATCARASAEGIKSLDWSVYAGPHLLRKGAPVGWRGKECPIEDLARLLAVTGEPVVVLHGRAEIGPRALGNRSIISPAHLPVMKSLLNGIKLREDYRPVAPICLEHEAGRVFDVAVPDPYMIFECRVRSEWRGKVPAIVHEDGTARVQTVNQIQNPVIFALLSEYNRLTGVPLLCNTSANQSGCGFFASDHEAMVWGKTNYVWAEGTLYTKSVKTDFGVHGPTDVTAVESVDAMP